MRRIARRRSLIGGADRVAVTDINGVYEMAFMPGFNDQLYNFAAVAPGYSRSPRFGGGIVPPPTGL